VVAGIGLTRGAIVAYAAVRVTELRLLRLSAERTLNSQTEINAMGVLLATVQSRITQLT